MPGSPRAVYTEHTPWPGWVWVVIWGTLALGAAAILTLEDDVAMERRLVYAALLLGTGVFVQWLVGGVIVKLHRDHLVVGLGRTTLIRRTVRYEEIVRTEVRGYSPLREFGGWGYRFSGNKRAFTARGDEAVVLHLADGLQIYIGSDRPGRLRERIEAVAGNRMGAAAGTGEEEADPPG